MRVKEIATPYFVTSKRYTYADYAALPDDGRRYEIIEGELFMSPAPVPEHQRASRKCGVLLSNFVEKRSLGEVFFAPIDVMFSDDTVVQPDILFISRERLGIIGEKYIDGAPDLIMEILSPGTAYNDLVTKKDLYAQFGVKEYWLIDPGKRWIEIYTPGEGRYQLHQRVEKTGKACSKLLAGFCVKLEELFSG
ncbi:MAG: Uma2 family endonuclease [Calditrichaeota bacterium]|nr:MAG: Uma2 family endonuclease [Calditrichota bacterium]